MFLNNLQVFGLEFLWIIFSAIIFYLKNWTVNYAGLLQVNSFSRPRQSAKKLKFNLYKKRE